MIYVPHIRIWRILFMRIIRILQNAVKSVYRCDATIDLNNVYQAMMDDKYSWNIRVVRNA